MKKMKILALFLTITLISTNAIYAKWSIKDELNMQFGFGFIASTGNLLNLIENAKIYNAAINGETYEYPGMTTAEKNAFKNLSFPMKRAIMVANIMGSMDYGLDFRFKWSVLLVEVDLSLLPYDGSYNGKLDFMIVPMAGVRLPFFIMPYFLVGPILTFSFYPDKLAQIESWRNPIATTSNFAFRTGLNFRLGLDFKFTHFSIGPYYQYTIKDFDEFGAWYRELVDAGVSPGNAGGMIFGAQSRFGAAVNFYLP